MDLKNFVDLRVLRVFVKNRGSMKKLRPD